MSSASDNNAYNKDDNGSLDVNKTSASAQLHSGSFHVEQLEDRDRYMTLSIGPQHPGSGHMRIIIVVDGDIIVSADPDVGYVHRGEEKMSEYRTFLQNVPHIERPVIHDSSNILYSYCLAVEELIGLQVPERAMYLRVLLAEIDRIQYTLYWLAILGIFMGHSTMFMWATADRELFVDLADMASGNRITHAYIVPGGVRNDLPDGFADKAVKFLDYFERKRLPEYDKIFYDNPLFRQRSEGVGLLSKADAINLGVTGSVLRASGVNYDVRKDEPYDIYNQFDFEVPIAKTGDSFARSILPMYDIRQRINIIRQCLTKMPQSGQIRAKLQPNPRGPPGEAYSRVESGRGALGHYIVSDGTPKPYRHKMSVPSVRNLSAMPHLLKGAKLADLPVIYWSLNIWPVEIER
ncbi:MAG TPA: NADH-quinone oxidoreductase subunit D [Nitrososphaeraceae archaeon]|nr:NADH-quinone oxidoreductase subunit D [Nitrososphaeraceae archaeon]